MNLKPLRLAAACTCALATLAAAPAANAEPIKLRVADSFPTTHWVSVNITRHMMDRVTEMTNKAVEFEYYPAEQLGKAKDLLSLANSGVADISYVAPAFVGEKMPLSVVGELPLPTNSGSSCPLTMAYWKIAQPGGILDKREFAPNGVRLPFTIGLPPYQITTKPKFAGLKEISGMKVRTTGAPKELALRKLGAVPVQIPSPEINEAMSRGTVDGALMPIGSIPSYGLDTVVKHFTVGENFGSFVANYVISERKWKTLPSNVQKALQELGPELSKRGCEMADREEEANVKKLQQAGATIVSLNAADKAALKEMQRSVGSAWAEGLDKRGKPGTEILKAFTGAMPR
mgnify:CR=1 FL=1